MPSAANRELRRGTTAASGDSGGKLMMTKRTITRTKGPAGEDRDTADDGTPIRNVAGPADDATRSDALNKRLAEREPRPAPAPAASAAENPTKDLSLLTAADRVKHRGLQVDDAVDKATK